MWSDSWLDKHQYYQWNWLSLRAKGYYKLPHYAKFTYMALLRSDVLGLTLYSLHLL